MRVIPFAVLALAAHVRVGAAGAVPAFLTQTLPTALLPRRAAAVQRGGSSPACAGNDSAGPDTAAKPWADTGLAPDRIRVFLVRHGAVDLTTPGMNFPKNCFYGGHNVPLSALGEVALPRARAALRGQTHSCSD